MHNKVLTIAMSKHSGNRKKDIITVIISGWILLVTIGSVEIRIFAPGHRQFPLGRFIKNENARVEVSEKARTLFADRRRQNVQ